MAPRTLILVILATLIGVAAPISAKDKAEKKKPAKQAARTWNTIVDYVLKKGGEDSIHASAAQALGYESKEVPAKSLGLDPEKSKDGRDRGIFIVYNKSEKGDLIPKEIVLGSILVKEENSVKEIDSYRIRMALDGTLIRGMHAAGIVGQVVQQSLPSDSKELLSLYKKESVFYLKEVDLGKLTQ